MAGSMTRLQCHVQSAHRVTVVLFLGSLTVADAPLAWQMLTKVLAEQPDALLVDLTGITLGAPRALRVFGALARRASLWPGVPVILAAPGPEMHAALHRQAIDRQLAVCADPAEALVLAHGAPAPPRLRESMQPSPGAARRGRDMVTEACLRWHLPELVAPGSIVASELVTNAVRHTGAPFELLLARTSRFLHIAVKDQDPRLPRRRNVTTLATGGRGLLIVERTALSWGSSSAQTGKVVWATLAPGRAPAAA